MAANAAKVASWQVHRVLVIAVALTGVNPFVLAESLESPRYIYALRAKLLHCP